MPSEKTSGAGNQQERLRFIGWVIGFVDGEGCFTVSFFKHPKSRLRLKWQVFPEFVITQGMKSESALEEVKNFFGCGKIYLNKRYDNHHEHLLKYVVRNREDLLEKIIPFFEKNCLRTAKKEDFSIFAKIVRMMDKGKHLEEKGLEKIRLMVLKMNTRKFR
jgi:hypothetical protein